MKKLLKAILILTAFYPILTQAQETNMRISCGSEVTDLRFLVNNMAEIREKYKNILQVRGAIAYVPVTFHLVAKTDGTSRIFESKILDLLDAVNKTYTDNGIELQFYLRRFNYINNDNLFTAPKSLSAQNLSFNNKKSDSMNVFITENGGATSNASDGVVLAYYSNRSSSVATPYETDWIVCIKSQSTAANVATFAHEIGHFFSLGHTFNGWEPDPFHPTTANPIAPKYASDNFTLTEYVSRESDGNCDIAGDRICDTPEDYNFGFTQGTDWNNPNNKCVYNGIAKDPSGIAVNPDETNLMGYYIGCQSKFTPLQKAAITRDYSFNTFRGYLRNGNTAPFLGTMATANLLTPAHQSVLGFFNNITLDWSDVPNTVNYLVEVCIRPTFQIEGEVYSFITSASNLTINTTNYPPLVANKNYFWRVRAYNTYKTGTFSTTYRFTTGSAATATKEIEGISEFTIAPNPVGQERILQYSLTSEKNFDGVIKIYNTTGQLVKTEKQSFIAGHLTQAVDVANLTSGLYIFSIESADRVIKKKFMISE